MGSDTEAETEAHLTQRRGPAGVPAAPLGAEAAEGGQHHVMAPRQVLRGSVPGGALRPGRTSQACATVMKKTSLGAKGCQGTSGGCRDWITAQSAGAQ